MFKPGDKVVRITGVVFPPGTKATIIEKCGIYNDDYLVEIPGEHLPLNWHKSSFVSEEVYNSPLFEVLKEKDND